MVRDIVVLIMDRSGLSNTTTRWSKFEKASDMSFLGHANTTTKWKKFEKSPKKSVKALLTYGDFFETVIKFWQKKIWMKDEILTKKGNFNKKQRNFEKKLKFGQKMKFWRKKRNFDNNLKIREEPRSTSWDYFGTVCKFNKQIIIFAELIFFEFHFTLS